jgi:hypothetical protein
MPESPITMARWRGLMKKVTAPVRKIFWMGMDYASRKGGEVRQNAETAHGGSLDKIDLSVIVARLITEID